MREGELTAVIDRRGKYELRRIRRLQSEDLAEMVALSHSEGFQFIDRLASDSDDEKPTFDAPGAFGFGWYMGEKLVAVGGLTPDPYVGIPAGRVRRVYVHPEHRRHGLGRGLIEAIILEGRSSYTVFTLRAATPQAAALYESLGFVASDLPETTHEMRLL
jgi:GNAT superfamily N-acetyltransferase